MGDTGSMDKQADQRFELGHSFVPEFRETETPETKEAPKTPGAPETPVFPETGQAQAAVGRRVKCVLEGQQPMSEEERARVFQFENSVGKIFEAQSRGLSQFITKIQDAIESKYLDKKNKYQVCRSILQEETGPYGIVRMATGNFRDRLHTGINNQFAMGMWEFLEKFREFFKEEMPDEDFDYLARKYIGELALSFYITEKDSPALWRASDYDEEMDKIKEIAKKYGVISPEQVAVMEAQAKIAIREVLMGYLTPKLYSGVIEGGKDESVIKQLAQKYGIELPTELEYWQKRVKDEMKKLEDIVRGFEEDKEAEYLRYTIKEKEKKVIGESLEVLREGFKKFGDEVLPDGVDSLDDWMQAFNERLENVKKFNLEHRFKKREERLVSDFKKAVDGRNSEEIRRVISFYEDLIKETEEDLGILGNLKNLLEQKISELDSEIKALLQRSSEDLSSAEKNGEAISALGKLRNILDAGLKKISGEN